jgi:ABC-type phosphate transport system substrate-binding protein
MSRTQLLGAASAAVLAAFTSGAYAQSTITGGGSTLAAADYIAEFSAFNSGETGTQATFGTYYAAGSTSGQRAFLYDDLSCDIDKVTPVPTYGTNCFGTTGSGPGTNAGQAGNTTTYGASDAVFDNAQAPFNPNDANQLTFWSTYSFGQAISGNLIQLPSMGVGIALPVNNAALKSNGALSLTDHDLCEIFSGGYTDFSQITDSLTPKGAATSFTSGAFTVVYRGDGSGTTFITTDHLATVCNVGTDTPTGFTFFATTSFATLFGGTPPGSTVANPGSNTKNSAGLQVVTSGLANSFAGNGSGGVAGFLEPASGPVPPAIGYISPDYTSLLAKTSFARVNGAPSTIKIAAAQVGKTPILPTVAAITTGLNRATAGYHTTAPSTAAQGANPSNWVPLVTEVSGGYPIVGYTTYDFAQCYADPTITSAVLAYLKAHYTKGDTEQVDQTDNGFVLIANSAASKFLTAINQHILANLGSAKTAWNTNIGNTGVCKANGGNTYVGR